MKYFARVCFIIIITKGLVNKFVYGWGLASLPQSGLIWPGRPAGEDTGGWSASFSPNQRGRPIGDETG